MAIYRTAQGKTLDMGALAARNEHTRAVGINMNVNARGDTIDNQGRVVVPVTKKVGNNYQKTVNNRAANARKRERSLEDSVDQFPINEVPPKAKEVIAPEVVEDIDLTEEELDFLDTSDEDLEIENIKAKNKGFEIKPASEAPEFFKPETKKK